MRKNSNQCELIEIIEQNFDSKTNSNLIGTSNQTNNCFERLKKFKFDINEYTSAKES